jgi:hypothetical protein
VSKAHDKRLRMIAVTVLSVALVGVTVRWLAGTAIPTPQVLTPGEIAPPGTPASSAGPGQRPFDKAGHVRDAILRQRFQQAVYMLHARQHEHAITALHEVLQLAPKLPEAHVNMGFALLGVERDAEAHDFFQGAIELRTSQVNAYYGLALARARLGKLPEAVGAMRTYVHLTSTEDPFVTKARAMLAEWETELAQGADPKPLSTEQTR